MSSSPYRLVSFNCKNVKRSIDGVRDLCRTCDLIALQETWLLPEDIPYLGTIDAGFCYTGTSAVDTAGGILRGRPFGGVALLWKSSVFQEVSVLQCDSARVCAIKLITNDRPVMVVNVYMPTDSRENLPDFTDCLSKVSAIVNEYGVESVFILGDFNADVASLFYTELQHFCNDHSLSCVDIDLLGLNSGTYTFISESHGSCSWLDHCVVTQSAKQSVVNVNVKYDTLWSDHFPLIVECSLDLLSRKIPQTTLSLNKGVLWGSRNENQIKTYATDCHNRLKHIDFPMEFSNCADKFCNDPNHRHVLDRLYYDIVAALRDASMADRGCRRSGRGESRVVGWNRHVGDAHGRARLHFREWVLCNRPRAGIVYDQMCESRRIFKSRLKWCQQHQEQIKMDALALKHFKGDFRGFWKDTNKVNAKPCLPVSVDGVSDHGGIAEVFRDHFSVQSPLGSHSLHNPDGLYGEVGVHFCAKEVAQVIRNMNKGKSPGHDGLSVEHLKHAGPHAARVLAVFYSLCVSHSYLPEDLMRTVVVPVLKNKTGNIADKANYRPISLATIIAKVFDGLLNTQLDKYTKLHDNQFGFRPKLSTESAILCLKHTVRYYTDRKTPVYACFLDLSRAFDLVAYDVLWEKLIGIDLPKEIVGIFRFWYTHQSNNVRWAGAVSESYRMECGVRQGGLTSPTLFNLYLNELIVSLSSLHVGCYIDEVCVNNLSYADDMVLLSASVCGLKKLIRLCEGYAERHGLKYNVRKSNIMVFETASARCPDTIPTVTLNSAPLERVTQFKYLGHIVTVGLKDHADIERERRALSRRANMLARRFARCTDRVKIALFRAYCTSLYTCALWANYSQKVYGALRVQFNNAFRAVLGLSRHCSASGMFAAAHVDCFHASMRKRRASLVRRVWASSNTVLRMIADRVDCPFVRNCCNGHVAVVSG
jgi:exonuclease III